MQDIIWAYKLAPETIDLPAGGGIAEIQVFRVLVKGTELDHDLLAAIDRAINFPVWFELHRARGQAAPEGGLIQPIAAPKETPKYSAFPAGQDARPFSVPLRH